MRWGLREMTSMGACIHMPHEDRPLQSYSLMLSPAVLGTFSG